MLTSRQENILRLIVDKYIKNPVPVGSKLLSKELKCSSATIRYECFRRKRIIRKDTYF